jgi:hypothetical protein
MLNNFVIDEDAAKKSGGRQQDGNNDPYCRWRGASPIAAFQSMAEIAT